MDSGRANIPTTRKVRCKDCGSEFENYRWLPGMPCPTCKSQHFEPVVIIGKTSDYAHADRSKGFAAADIRFGRTAQWAQMISPKQLQRALFEQSHMARQGTAVPDLAQLLIKNKTLTRRQVNAILNAHNVEPANADDIEFGISATRAGFATEAQVTECRRAQREAAETGGDVLPLPVIMVEHRYMTEAQVLALLQKLATQSKGMLNELRIAARGNAGQSRRRHGSLWQQLQANPQARTAVIAVSLLILGLLVWKFFIAGETMHTIMKCDHCGAEGGAPVSSPWPLPCSNCKQKKMYPLYKCLTCGERYIIRDMLHGTDCPKCHKSRRQMLRGDVDEGDLQRRIEAGEFKESD